MADLADDVSGPDGMPVSPSEPAIRDQLERILASPQFAASDGARRLLRFVVEETLAGRADTLKEYTLATEVLGRDASFDPKLSPAVRVEAGRLRQRLERYYLTLGRDDPVLIELPRGGYVPRFESSSDVLHLRDHLAEVTRELDASAGDFAPTLPGGPAIAVLPFENLSGEGDQPFGNGISIEILTALSRFHEFRLLGRGTVFGYRGERDVAQLRANLGAAANRVPRSQIPNWMVRLAALRDPAVRQILPELGKTRNATSAKAERLLGWRPRSCDAGGFALRRSLLRFCF